MQNLLSGRTACYTDGRDNFLLTENLERTVSSYFYIYTCAYMYPELENEIIELPLLLFTCSFLN